jgi:hypothetical protein
MLSQTIWGISFILEALVLVRGLKTGLAFRYPVFHAYLLFVMAQSCVRLVVRSWYSWKAYTSIYWITEVLAFAFGCLVVFEIYRIALADYPGTAKIARRILLLLCLLAAAKAVTVWSADPNLLINTTPLKVEYALRTVQAFSLAALVSAFAFYSIPFGRNLRGILLGYGVFIGERVICLTFVSEAGKNFWYYAYSASYIVALTLWAVYLWSSQPMPAKQRSQSNNEYERIAAATQRRLQSARGYLRKAVRS